MYDPNAVEPEPVSEQTEEAIKCVRTLTPKGAEMYETANSEHIA